MVELGLGGGRGHVLLRSCVVVFMSRVHVGVSVLCCRDSFGHSAYFDMLTFLPCVYRSEGRLSLIHI